jgi:hypothetical protein
VFTDEKSYLQHRAETEVERAQQATQPNVVRAHCVLAEAYLDKLTSLDAIETKSA